MALTFTMLLFSVLAFAIGFPNEASSQAYSINIQNGFEEVNLLRSIQDAAKIHIDPAFSKAYSINIVGGIPKVDQFILPVISEDKQRPIVQTVPEYLLTQSLPVIEPVLSHRFTIVKHKSEQKGSEPEAVSLQFLPNLESKNIAFTSKDHLHVSSQAYSVNIQESLRDIPLKPLLPRHNYIITIKPQTSPRLEAD